MTLSVLTLMALCAGPPPTRVVLSGASRPDVLRQLEDEFRLLGFEVEVDRQATAMSWKDLRQRARQAKAVAALQIEQDGEEIALWVSDLATGKVMVRALPATKDQTPRLIALRAVELLQVSLQEVSQASAIREVPAPAVLTPPRAPPRAPPGWGLSLGGRAAFGPGPLSAWGSLVAELEWRAFPSLAFSAGGTFGVLPARVTAREGTALIRWSTLQLGARYALPAFGRFEPGVLARAGVLLAEMVGTGIAPYEGRVDAQAVGWVEAGAAVRVVLTRSFALRTELLVSTSIPRLGVRFGAREVAAFPLPTVGVALVAEVGFGE